MYAGTDPLTRRPIRFRATARTETQARIELGKLLEKARDGRSPEASVTMAKLLDEYAPIAQWDVSTRQTSEGFIRRTLKPAIGHLKIRQVNGEILDKLYARLMRCRELSCTGHPFTGHRHMPILKVDPAGIRPAWKRVATTLAEAITSGVLLIRYTDRPAVQARSGARSNWPWPRTRHADQRHRATDWVSICHQVGEDDDHLAVDDSGGEKNWLAQIRGWPAECTCPPLQHQA